MRRLAAVCLFLFALPSALAAEWGQYDNPRFGYVVAVPPGYAPDSRAADNGDGLTLRSEQGTQRLVVWGGWIIAGDFDAHVADAIQAAAADGWAITDRVTTPGWASFSGTRNGQVLYAREIALCDGRAYASLRLNYPQRDIADMGDLAGRLGGSLRAVPGAC